MNVYVIRQEFNLARRTKSDINEHLDYLRELAAECNHVVEAGVRYVVSTWALLLGCACKGGKVVSYCWNRLPEITRAEEICKAAGVDWTYIDGDWLKHTIPETDLLFIDTNHFYSQLKEELRLHGSKARKYIVLHDTTSFGEVGADGKSPGLWQAVEEFVARGEWKVLERRTHNNGLTVLSRMGR